MCMLMEKGREVMDRGAEHVGWRRRDRGKKVRGRGRERGTPPLPKCHR